MILISLVYCVPASHGDVPSSNRQIQRGVDLAVDILEDRVTSGVPRVQRVAFTTLSNYYCRPGGNRAQCAQFIVDGMQHEHWQVRLEALSNAFRFPIGEESRRQVLEQAVNRKGAINPRIVSKLLAEHPVSGEEPILEDLVRSPDLVVQEHAAAGLVRLGKTEHASVLKKGLYSSDDEAALEAARHVIALKIVEQAEQEQAEQVLRTQLTDRDELVRANAVYAVAELEDDAPWDDQLIERLMRDDSSIVRQAVVTSVPMVCSGQNRFDLVQLISRRYPEEQVPELRIEIINAIKALEKQGAVSSTSVKEFAQVLLGTEDDVRLQTIAVGILACRGEEEYRKKLVTAASNRKNEQTLRLISISALAECSDERTAEELALLLPQLQKEEKEREGAEIERITANTASAIVRMATARAVAAQTAQLNGAI